MEDEAELGSDNEENDDKRKRINAEDSEENEEGYDKDLEDFVVHGQGEAEGSEEEAMRDRFLEDMKA